MNGLDRRAARTTGIRRTVGILTETPGLYDNLSAEYNLRIFAHLYEVNDVAGQVEKYLRMLGLWERRCDEARHLLQRHEAKSWPSPGRCCTSRASLFLDEPTAALDPEVGAPGARFHRRAAQRRGARSSSAPTTWTRPTGCATASPSSRPGWWWSIRRPSCARQLFGRKVVFHLRQPGCSTGIARGRTVRLPFVQEAREVD